MKPRSAPAELRPVASLEVRTIETLAELRQCEALQDLVWGPEDVVHVSSLVMITVNANGGFTLGAFAGSRVVGFVLTAPGLTEAGHVKLCSILMAVDPVHQNGGVGFRLKFAQREIALARGHHLITWTFDPLASANAYLNLHKLGCVASRYLVDVYGTAECGLNAGLPTDRLLAEWWIREPAVAERLEGRLEGTTAEDRPAGPAVNRVERDPLSGYPVIREVDLDRADRLLCVEIPESIRAIKLADMNLARRWRAGLREILQSYFARGYRAAGFRRLPCDGRVRSCFLLEATA